MSVIFFGSPEFAVPSLKALVAAGFDVVAAVTQPDKRKGRGGHPTPCPVKEAALAMGIHVIDPRSIRDEAIIAELRSYKPEFLAVVAYGKILPDAVLAIPSKAPVNVHASLLPAYRGAAPIAWAIMDGLTETGLTTMLMSSGLDEGDILIEERHAISPDDTTESLSARLAEAGGPLLVRTLRGMRDGSVKPRPQGGQSSYARILTKEDGHISWEGSPQHIVNLIRGLYPWPCAYTSIDGQRVKIIKARASNTKGAPGAVISADNGGIAIGTGEGSVLITELQPDGKRPMSSAAYLMGRKVKSGAVAA